MMTLSKPLLQANLSEFPVDCLQSMKEWTPRSTSEVEEAIEGQSRWSLDVNGIQLGFSLSQNI